MVVSIPTKKIRVVDASFYLPRGWAPVLDAGRQAGLRFLLAGGAIHGGAIGNWWAEVTLAQLRIVQ